MAASTSAHSNNDYRYEVFINSGEAPVKKTFASHLYRRLITRGLRVFLDQQELQEGEELPCQTEGAIRTASVQIAIISPTYADSQYCLDRLVLMLESRAPIIPVFYAVKPSELRWTKGEGKYARSLQNLQSKRIETGQPRYDYSTIQNWRNALHRVAEISGFELDAFNGDEGELMDQVVEEVWRTMRTKSDLMNQVFEEALRTMRAKTEGWSTAPKYVVGLQEKVEDFENKVLWAKPQVVGIVGVGGVGKTTLAKELFHQKRVNYSKCCFLPNVREKARLGILNSLQRQLLKSLTGKDELINNNIDEGKKALKKHLSSGRVLMVLDDVDHLYPIDALLPVRTHLSSDSLVLITSRDEGVIRSSGVEHTAIYQVTGLNHQHSQELFCAHAFNQPYPHPEFASLVDNFLEACGGLPSWLRVYGELLNDERNPLRWKELLVEIQQVLPSQTQEKLTILPSQTQEKLTRKYVVGLHEKVEEFENKVLCAKPQVVGIVGVGGVGKTTLAEELFLRKRVNYSKCCFLPNVREKARLGLLNSLQRQLLKSLTGTDAQMNSIGEGTEALKKPLSSCRVLMVLDDVDHLNQIDALLPVRTHLLSDSLVVITSRDKGAIRKSGVENASIYPLTGLNHQYSRHLFCAFAFNQPHPPLGFESLVHSFLEVCEGLPLLLRVFGALLNDNKDVQYIWEYLLDRLQQIPQGETQKKLQISYHILNREEQQIFLDSSCFFIGQKRDTAIRIWGGSGWYGLSGFRTLEDRCLLGVDEENNIEMHDHLRDFGRSVADTSSPRRLLHSNHIKDMLERLSNEQGAPVGNEAVTAVRGIRMVLGEDNDDVNAFGGVEKGILELLDAVGGVDVTTLELLDTQDAILERILRRMEEHVPSLIWLRWNKCPEPSLPSWIPVRNLRVLQVSGSELRTLWEDVLQAPLLLEELEINAPLSNIPESIGQLRNLERIAIGKFSSGGQVNLTKLPEGFCDLPRLKDLVLTECSKMKSLPDAFDGSWELQHIDLSFCRNLERLPDSLGELRYLRHINLSDCHDLVRLPDSICGLRRLQHIDLQGCHNLERLPDSIGDLRDLRHINLSGCHDLQRLPDSFGELRYLQHIDLQGCHNLEELPTTFGNLMNLLHINLSNCHDLERLPESFGNLSNLQYIDLSGCYNLERLPNNFRNLKKLKYLDVEGCANLIIDTFEISEISVYLPSAHQRQLEQLQDIQLEQLQDIQLEQLQDILIANHRVLPGCSWI